MSPEELRQVRRRLGMTRAAICRALAPGNRRDIRGTASTGLVREVRYSVCRGSCPLAGGLSIDQNLGSPVTQLYWSPLAFTGTVFKVTADVSGQNLHETERGTKSRGQARDDPPIGAPDHQ